MCAGMVTETLIDEQTHEEKGLAVSALSFCFPLLSLNLQVWWLRDCSDTPFRPHLEVQVKPCERVSQTAVQFETLAVVAATEARPPPPLQMRPWWVRPQRRLKQNPCPAISEGHPQRQHSSPSLQTATSE